MKSKSDNFREASIIDIMRKLKKRGINIIIYEPILQDRFYLDYEVVDSPEELDQRSDVIIANRMTLEIQSYSVKVYTRDLFGDN